MPSLQLRFFLPLILCAAAIAQVGPGNPQILPNAQIGVFYSFNPFPHGCPSTCTSYYISVGTLPPGLTVNPATGVTSGIPTTPGVFGFTSAATFPPNLATIAEYQITVTAAPTGAPISPAGLMAMTIGLACVGWIETRRLGYRS